MRIPSAQHQFTGQEIDRPVPSFTEILPDTKKGRNRLSVLRKTYRVVRWFRRQVSADKWAVPVIVVQVYET